MLKPGLGEQGGGGCGEGQGLGTPQGGTGGVGEVTEWSQPQRGTGWGLRRGMKVGPQKPLVQPDPPLQSSAGPSISFPQPSEQLHVKTTKL